MIVSKKLQNNEIGWLAQETIKNVISLYQSIVNKVVDTPQTAQFFIQSQKSLELIFEILNINS